MSAGTISKTAKMVRRNRIIIVGGVRMKVLDAPTTEEDPTLGTMYVFRCEVMTTRVIQIVRRSPGARVEVER